MLGRLRAAWLSPWLRCAPEQDGTMDARASGITASLNRLGIRVTTGQWIGAVISVLAGIIMARILPYAYPIFFSRILDFVFGPGMSTLRDGFNSLFMTMCTMGTSFAVSLVTFVLFRKKRKAAA
jgi:hypothetical protein